jgi:hypothetical protein
VEQHLNVVGPSSCCSADEFFQQLEANCQFLLSARPTAINLANAFAELVECIRQLKEELEGKAQQPCEGSNIGSQVDQLKSRWIDCQLIEMGKTWIEGERQKILRQNIIKFGERILLFSKNIWPIQPKCRVIFSILFIFSTNSVHDFVLNWQARERHSNDKLLRNAVHGVIGAVEKHRLVVMSICNTGQLATSSFGTALGEWTFLCEKEVWGFPILFHKSLGPFQIKF